MGEKRKLRKWNAELVKQMASLWGWIALLWTLSTNLIDSTSLLPCFFFYFPFSVCDSQACGWRSPALGSELSFHSTLCLEWPLFTHIPVMASLCLYALVAMEPVCTFLVENCSVQGHCRKLLVIYLGRVRNNSFSDLAFVCFWKMARGFECVTMCK